MSTPDRQPVIPKNSYMQQAAALPVKRSGSRLRVLLVTSRQDGRWILPKGQIEDDESAAEGAAREAFEEAGVKGRAGNEALGTYRYLKQVDHHRAVSSQVTVFPLLVRKELQKWPEARERKRRWFPLETAAEKVGDRELGLLLKRFSGSGTKALREILDALD